MDIYGPAAILSQKKTRTWRSCREKETHPSLSADEIRVYSGLLGDLFCGTKTNIQAELKVAKHRIAVPPA